MITQAQVKVPLNRVEGDLEVHVLLDGRTVADAWSSGTMYRGIENLLLGRGPLDSLVITPRVCGICSVSHLTAAVKALEAAAGATPLADAVRVRNLALMTELIQSDLRHTFLLFLPDFAEPFYDRYPFHEECVRRVAPLSGSTTREVLRETRGFLEIAAILGGQWPHSSFMVPGGVIAVPDGNGIAQCMHRVRRFRRWYEERVLGCTLDRWSEVQSASDLEAWIEEDARHRDSEVGFFLRIGRLAGLDRIGIGRGDYLSFGLLDIPEGSEVRPLGGEGAALVPAGFHSRGTRFPLDPARIEEFTDYSWYEESEEGRHPFLENTRPYASGGEGKKYSWAKAPRYDGSPAETGPLAERILAGDPLFLDLTRQEGASVLVRQLARLVRPALLLPVMNRWLREIQPAGAGCRSATEIRDGQGFGLVEAARGALGHWVRIEDGKIVHYQIITPTAWNGSPRDARDVRGPWEEALLGVEVEDLDHFMELGHVVRSFDPCLVCTVHCLKAEDARIRR